MVHFYKETFAILCVIKFCFPTAAKFPDFIENSNFWSHSSDIRRSSSHSIPIKKSNRTGFWKVFESKNRIFVNNFESWFGNNLKLPKIKNSQILISQSGFIFVNRFLFCYVFTILWRLVADVFVSRKKVAWLVSLPTL